MVRTQKRRKGGALAKPNERDAPNTTLLNQSPGHSDAHADSFVFSVLGRRLSRGLLASLKIYTAAHAMYSGVLKLPYPTRRSRARSGAAGCAHLRRAAATDQGPRAGCSRSCTAVQHTGASWHDALRRRGRPAWPHPAQNKPPQVLAETAYAKPLGTCPPSTRPGRLRYGRAGVLLQASAQPSIDPSRVMLNAGYVHACKHCALCRAVTCRRHLEGLCRRPSTGAAGRSRCLGDKRLRVVKRRAPREHSPRMKSATTGAPEATARCSPLSALAFELVDQFKLPTIRSAVVSLTTSRAFEWCSPFRPTPTVAPRPSATYASRTE